MKLLISVSIMAIAAALFAGCSTKPRGKAAPTQAAAKPAPNASASATNKLHQVAASSDIRGEITQVNLPARFVVLNFPVGVLPAKGAILGVYRQGVKAGEIQVSGPQRDTFTIADILKGECRLGDEVRP